MSVYSGLNFGGPPWVLIAEMDETEVADLVRPWPALIAAVIAALLAAAVAHIAHRMYTGP